MCGCSKRGRWTRLSVLSAYSDPSYSFLYIWFNLCVLEVVVKLPLLIGTAVGFILLGAVIAIVPTILLVVGLKAKEPSSASDVKADGMGMKTVPQPRQGNGFANPGYDGETKGHM